MPKATLLKPPHTDYTLVRGNRNYVFIGGKPVSVPVEVALELDKRVDDRNKKLFKVISDPAPIAASSSVETLVRQNVVGKFRQLRVEECL